MKLNLQIRKNGNALDENVHEISDADSFGRECAPAWTRLRERMVEASSVAALFEALDDDLLEELYGAEICLCKA
jgi:hypothetical protein